MQDEVFPYLNLPPGSLGYLEPDGSGHISPRETECQNKGLRKL